MSWDTVIWWFQLLLVIAIADLIFQLIKDFFPSIKTIFGILALIAGFIGIKGLKDYFNRKDEQFSVNNK